MLYIGIGKQEYSSLINLRCDEGENRLNTHRLSLFEYLLISYPIHAQIFYGLAFTYIVSRAVTIMTVVHLQ